SPLKLDELSKPRWRLLRRSRDFSRHDGPHRLQQLRLSVLENTLEKSIPFLGSLGLFTHGPRTPGVDAVRHKRLAVRRPAFSAYGDAVAAWHDDYRDGPLMQTRPGARPCTGWWDRHIWRRLTGWHPETRRPESADGNLRA